VCTNGILIDRDLAKYFRKHNVCVSVGCDGPGELHDAVRRDLNDQGTFQQVVRALRILVEEGVETWASTSVTPRNIDYINRFSEFFAELGVAKFGFNFLRGKLLFRLVPADNLAEYYDRATDGVLANYRNFGERHLEAQVERRHRAILDQNFFPTDCNGYGNQIVVEPNGMIGNCAFIKADMSSVHGNQNFRIRDVPRIHDWRRRLPLYNSECTSCDAKSICGGGCAWNSIELKNDPYALDEATCMLTRKIFNDLVWSTQPEKD
jgi:uncharacterized protein